MPNFETIKPLYKSVQKPIHKREEKSIKINQVFVYPVRGIRAPKPLKELWLGAHGIKYDREIVLMTEDGKNCGSNNYKPMCCLTQELQVN